MFGFGKRYWTLIEKHELPSAFEQAAAAGIKYDSINSRGCFRKKVIYIFQCQLTKKLKKIVEYNP